MTKNIINSDNWTFCHYASQNLKALITIGASPDSAHNELDYYATVIDEDNQEVFQKEFRSLEQTCTYLNNRYADIWDFIDNTATSKKEGGCSTCVAH